MDGSILHSSDRTKAEAFLKDLTELSAKHGVAIAGTPTLFMMERDDLSASYRMDKDSNLSLA